MSQSHESIPPIEYLPLAGDENCQLSLMIPRVLFDRLTAKSIVQEAPVVGDVMRRALVNHVEVVTQDPSFAQRFSDMLDDRTIGYTIDTEQE